MPAPRLSKAKPPKPKTITRVEIEKLQALEDQRRELNRQAYLLAKQADAIEGVITAWVEAHVTGTTRVVARSGYELSLVDEPGSVHWKTQYVEAFGQAKAEALVAAAPPKTKLKIRKL
jgi:hypothetical protein